MNRRNFIAASAATGIASAANVSWAQGEQGVNNSNPADPAQGLPLTESPSEMRGEMLYRTLGRTGETVSAIGMGGWHLSKPGLGEDESIRLMRQAIDRGINFMDNCWDYNDGESERRMGKALKDGYRQKVFLMSKVDGRTKESAAKQIDESLKRLQTDRVDLMQHHEVLRHDDPDRIFDKGGAMEAFEEAKAAGKIRFIGFTGHKDPRVHLYTLQVAAEHGFRFDTVQMPLNVLDAHFRSFAQLVLPELVRQGIGVLGMKPLAGGDGILLKTNAVKAGDCLRYALSLPTSVVITGIDKQDVLDQAFRIVKEFKPYTRGELAELLGKTKEVAAKGEYELFKTSSHFDTTAQHPEFMGGENERVKKLGGAA